MGFPVASFFLQLLFPGFRGGREGSGEPARSADFLLIQPSGDSIFLHHLPDFFLIRFRADSGLIAIFQGIRPGLCPGFQVGEFFRRQGLAQICPGVFGIQIQHFLKEAIRLLPLPILQGHLTPIQDGTDPSGIVTLDDHRFLHGLLRLDDLADIPHHILHRTDLVHILALQRLQGLGDIHIGIHFTGKAGENLLIFILFPELQEPAPFVPDPHRVEMLIAAAHHQHHRCGVQRRENVRFVFLTQMIFQGNSGVEYPITGLGQGIIQLIRLVAVDGAVAGCILFFIADEDIVGVFFCGNGNDPFPQKLDVTRLIQVHPTGG